MSKSGLAVSYEYDAGGNRVSKTVNGSTRTMVVHGGVLLGETLPGGARLEYLRDAGGTAYGMIYTTAGGTRYT